MMRNKITEIIYEVYRTEQSLSVNQARLSQVTTAIANKRGHVHVGVNHGYPDQHNVLIDASDPIAASIMELVKQYYLHKLRNEEKQIENLIQSLRESLKEGEV